MINLFPSQIIMANYERIHSERSYARQHYYPHSIEEMTSPQLELYYVERLSALSIITQNGNKFIIFAKYISALNFLIFVIYFMSSGYKLKMFTVKSAKSQSHNHGMYILTNFFHDYGIVFRYYRLLQRLVRGRQLGHDSSWPLP